jgi:hypothetical protein
MSAFNIEDTAAIVSIAGQVQVVKRWLPDKWLKLLPVVAIAFGVLYAFAIKPDGHGVTMAQSIALGVMLGISATGIHSGMKNGVEFVKNGKKP